MCETLNFFCNNLQQKRNGKTYNCLHVRVNICSILQSSLETSIEEPCSTNDKTNDDDQQNNTDSDIKDNDSEMKDNKAEESDIGTTNISSVPQEDVKEGSNNGELNVMQLASDWYEEACSIIPVFDVFCGCIFCRNHVSVLISTIKFQELQNCN